MSHHEVDETLVNRIHLGPVLVSASVIRDPNSLSFRGSINGEVMQEDNAESVQLSHNPYAC
jgi:2-keto-4-pentenoate hydratase/2-oxohepta-3-ene-1,7-dioic acid hydratase in catechol pathway